MRQICLILGLGFLAVIISLSCSKDSPTEPTEPTDYPVYFRDANNEYRCYEYHPETDSIDSFEMPVSMLYGIEVSADGRIMYVNLQNSIVVYDLDTDTIITELPYAGNVIVSPDNQTIAIAGDDLYILETSDYTVLFQDTASADGGQFTTDGDRLYCTGSSDKYGPFYVQIIDLSKDFAITRRVFTEGMASEVTPSNDESKWFIRFTPGACYAAFGVYDVQSDSLIFGHSLSNGACDQVLTPDGRYLFYTSSTSHLSLDLCRPPDEEFYIYDVMNDTQFTVSTAGIVEGQLNYLTIWETVITPNGKWMVGLMQWGPGYLIKYDMSSMEISGHIELGGDRQINCLTCQNSR